MILGRLMSCHLQLCSVRSSPSNTVSKAMLWSVLIPGHAVESTASRWFFWLCDPAQCNVPLILLQTLCHAVVIVEDHFRLLTLLLDFCRKRKGSRTWQVETVEPCWPGACSYGSRQNSWTLPPQARALMSFLWRRGWRIDVWLILAMSTSFY